MGILGDRDDQPKERKIDPENQRHRKKIQSHKTSHTANAKRQAQDGMFSVEYLNKLLEDDHHLDTATLDLLTILLNKNWAISNLGENNIEEMKWRRLIIRKKLYAVHPDHSSPLQGDYRAFCFDDPTDTLKPLSQRQRMEIDQLLMTIEVMTHRSKSGWQQDQLSKSISVSEYRDSQPDRESGGILSFK